MDDQKMKIKIVVRPDEARSDAAMEEAQHARVRRNRFGLAALSALVAISVIAAVFFFLREEPEALDQADRNGSAVVAQDQGQSATTEGASGEDANPGDARAENASGKEPTLTDENVSRAPAPADPNGAEQPGSSVANGGAVDTVDTGDGGAITGDETAPDPMAANGQADPAQAPATEVPAADAVAPTVGTSPDTGGGVAQPTGGDDRTGSGVSGAVPHPAPGRAAAKASDSATAASPIQAPKQPSARAQGQERPQAGSSGQAAGAPNVANVPAKPSPGVARAQLTSGVSAREPVDDLGSPVDLGPRGRNVYYFNEFRNLSGQTVTHRWEFNDKIMATIPFRIGGDRWRVYSSKRIGPSQGGLWRVSAIDRNGTVLASTTFEAN